jgi:hypothetical protein
MNAVPIEVAVTTIVFYSAWMVGVLAVLVMGRRQDRLATQPPTIPPATGIDWSGWRGRLRSNLIPALILAVLYLVASLVLGQINPIAGGVFCQALVGLAIAYSIRGFEPLPVIKAIREHRQAVRAVVLMIAIGLVANLAAKIVGGLGLSAGSIFGEHDLTRQAASSFHVNAFQAFFVLLGGGGVAEEVMFRLVAVSLVWKLTGHAWMGVAAGALLFAAYHYTPLDGLYRTFWQFPVAALVSNLLVGSVWGIVYVKRGLETAVVGHTLLDWFTFLVFVH